MSALMQTRRRGGGRECVFEKATPSKVRRVITATLKSAREGHNVLFVVGL